MENKKIILLIVLSLTFTFFATAQMLKKGDTVDRIVAIVGDEPITDSEVKGRIVFMMQQNPSIKLDDKVLYKNVLSNIIDEKLVVAKAKLDSIEVTDDEIDQRWQMFLEQSIAQLGSEQRVEQVYGMSIPKMKNEFRDEIRNKLLSSKIIDKEFAQLSVSNKDVEDFYNQFKDSLQEVPETYSLYRITKKVSLKLQKQEEVYKLAMKVRDSIIAGGSFKDFAQRYSDDASTAKDGGDLGWIQKGKFLPELEKAGFNLMVGEVSLPILTPLGFHILKLRDKKNDQILISHILFKLGQSEQDKEIAKRFLDSLKKDVHSLDDFKRLAKKYSDDDETKGFGGYIGNLPLDALAYQVRDAITKISDGQVTETIPFNTDANNFSYQILFREKLIPKHKPSLKDDFALLQQQATQYKRVSKYNEWIAKLRKEMYWEIIPQ